MLFSNGVVLVVVRLQKPFNMTYYHCYIIVVASFQPDIVIVQLGDNNLTSREPVHVGSAIDDLVKLLHDVHGIRFICVCARHIHRKGASDFHRYVGILK